MARGAIRLLWGALAIGLALQGVLAAAQDAKPSREADTRRTGRGAGTKADAFGSKNWKPAPPVKKAVKVKPAAPLATSPEPPPPPSAPPIPYTYLGRLVDGAVTTVFLTDRQRNLAVKVGDVIDNNYRLEQITDSSLTLTYLPLNAQQQLSLGAPR